MTKGRSGSTAAAPAIMPGVGFEPTRPFGQRILSPPRLPFRHPGRGQTWPSSRSVASAGTVDQPDGLASAWIQRSVVTRMTPFVYPVPNRVVASDPSRYRISRTSPA